MPPNTTPIGNRLSAEYPRPGRSPRWTLTFLGEVILLVGLCTWWHRRYADRSSTDHHSTSRQLRIRGRRCP